MQDDGKYPSRFSTKTSGGLCAVLPIVYHLTLPESIHIFVIEFLPIMLYNDVRRDQFYRKKEIFEMNYTIRPLKLTEYGLLEDFLYEAIFIPEGVQAPPRDIIDLPELQVCSKDVLRRYLTFFGIYHNKSL